MQPVASEATMPCTASRSCGVAGRMSQATMPCTASRSLRSQDGSHEYKAAGVPCAGEPGPCTRWHVLPSNTSNSTARDDRWRVQKRSPASPQASDRQILDYILACSACIFSTMLLREHSLAATVAI